MDEILKVSSEVAEKINKCFAAEKIIKKLDERFENISVNSNNNLNLCYKSFLEVRDIKDTLLKNYYLTINALKELTDKERIEELKKENKFVYVVKSYFYSAGDFDSNYEDTVCIVDTEEKAKEKLKELVQTFTEREGLLVNHQITTDDGHILLYMEDREDEWGAYQEYWYYKQEVK